MVVLVIAAIKKFAKNGVVETFSQLGLLVLQQQLNVAGLDLFPKRFVKGGNPKFVVQEPNGFSDSLVIEMNPLPGRFPGIVPPRFLKALLGAGGYLLEQRDVLLESVQYGSGNFLCPLRFAASKIRLPGTAS